MTVHTEYPVRPPVKEVYFRHEFTAKATPLGLIPQRSFGDVQFSSPTPNFVIPSRTQRGLSRKFLPRGLNQTFPHGQPVYERDSKWRVYMSLSLPTHSTRRDYATTGKTPDAVDPQA